MPTTRPKADSSKLLNDNGLDLSVLPPILTADELAQLLKTTTASLAQDRYRGAGVPYVRHGNRIRYLRADVGKYLMDNHVTPASAKPAELLEPARVRPQARKHVRRPA